jgi:hypothetical protein
MFVLSESTDVYSVNSKLNCISKFVEEYTYCSCSFEYQFNQR